MRIQLNEEYVAQQREHYRNEHYVELKNGRTLSQSTNPK
jgi:hypothetical protein